MRFKICRDVLAGLLSTAETKNLCQPSNPYGQTLHFMQHLEPHTAPASPVQKGLPSVVVFKWAMLLFSTLISKSYMKGFCATEVHWKDSTSYDNSRKVFQVLARKL